MACIMVRFNDMHSLMHVQALQLLLTYAPYSRGTNRSPARRPKPGGLETQGDTAAGLCTEQMNEEMPGWMHMVRPLYAWRQTHGVHREYHLSSCSTRAARTLPLNSGAGTAASTSGSYRYTHRQKNSAAQ